MTDRDALIARLESASEGSRELDVAIRDTLGLPAQLVPPDDGDEAYPYTTSLDAALTLVPEGARWHVDSGVYEPPKDYRAEVDYSGIVWGTTPALALCIAALRARAAS